MTSFTYAKLVDGVPNVANPADRDALYPSPDKYQKIYVQSTNAIQQWDGAAWQIIFLGTGTAGSYLFAGTGSPEGVQTAAVSSVYLQTDGTNGATFWVKRTGTGNTGWVLYVATLGDTDVDNYGALGDGTTDDAVAILAAIAAAPVGGTIRFHPGKNYAISSQISWSKRLTVSGYGATITEKVAINGANAAGAMFLASAGADGTVVEGLTFAGIETEIGFSGGATKQYCGCRFDTIARGTMRDLRATNKTYGFFANACTDLTVDDFRSTGFMTTNADPGFNFNAGIQIASCQRFRVTGHAQSHGDVILVGSPSTTSSDGTITVNGKLLYDSGCYVSSGTRITVADSHFDQISSNGGSGIILRGTNNAATGCTVSNVTGGSGYDVTGNGADDGTGYSGSGHSIKGCKAFTIDRWGILTDSVSGLYPRDCVFEGNILDTCAVAGSGYYAYQLAGAGHQFVNNEIYNTAATANGVGLVNGTVGAPCPNIKLIGNNVRAAATGPAVAHLVSYVTNGVIANNTLEGAGTAGNFDLRNLTNTTVFGNQGGTLSWNASFPSSSCQSFANEVTYAGDLTNLWAQGVEFASGVNVKHFTASRAAKTANYTLTDADYYVPGSVSGGAITLTLPDAVARPNRVYVLAKIDTSVNAVTVATTSSQTIGTPTTTSYTLRTVGRGIAVMSNGANWEIIAQFGPPNMIIAGGTYTLNASDDVVQATANAGAATVNLPSAASYRGRIFTVVKTDATANTVTIARAGSDTILGATTYVLSTQYDAVALQSDGVSAWFVVADRSLYSPAFLGVPTAPTATANTNTTQLATTAYVDRATTHTGTTSAAPTGTTSATAVMMGLAGSITPTRGTKIIFMVAGQMGNATAGSGATVDLRFGTGAAPTNGAAVTGTLVGIAQTATSVSAAQRSGFSHLGKVTGLSVGTAYWFDLSLLAPGGTGTATVTGCSLVAFEVP